MQSEKRSLLDKALQVLEWPALTSRLAERAVSALGAEACREIDPASGGISTLEAAGRSIAETSEMADLLREDGAVPVGSFEDIRPALKKAQKGAVLDPEELAQLSSLLELARLIRGFFKNQRSEYPLLWERAQFLDELRDLKKEIDRAIDHSGKLKENASPELRKLTQKARDLKANAVKRLEGFIAQQEVQQHLQDEYFTQRGSRYVVPVKAEFRSKIEGIVHDSSNSGQTLYIEPKSFIYTNNQIKMTEMDVEQESQRILRDLGDKAGQVADTITTDIEILVEIEVIYAKARLSLDMEGNEPSINDTGHIDLINARHPLLVLSPDEVVPNDILIESDLSALVISGPNTGGKTVTMKTVGLFALMVRAGLHIPADKGSAMAVFREVYADIGDEQDLGRHLSTFSGHVLNITGIIKAASEGALVLLDELVTSTDPAEGSALAEAILNRLAERGAKTITTTHYAQLKAYAQSSDRFANASVEFDSETLSPTYRLIMGVPGRSSALEIATKLGMDDQLINRASKLLGSADRRIEEMLVDLEKQKQHLAMETEEAEQLKGSARRLMDEQESLRNEIKSKEKEYRTSFRNRLSGEVESARKEIRNVMKSLSKERTRVQALEARKKIREIEEAYRKGEIIEGEEVDPFDLKKGDSVVVAHLGVVGVLMEDSVENGSLKQKVKVRIGRAPMVVPTSSLRADPGIFDSPKQADYSSSKRKSAISEEADFPGTRLDLRGYRADDAVDEVQRFLDRALLAQLPEVEILHGHGTGALKKIVRQSLEDSPYVAKWWPAQQTRGGDGVTIIEIKR